MPLKNINDLAEITTVADDDLILVLDVSDGSEGTEKKVQKSNLGGGVSDHGSLTGLGDDDHTQYTIISSGSGAPSSTPTRVGALYVDTAAGVAYIAKGTASSADWVSTSSGGGGSSDFPVAVTDEVTLLTTGTGIVEFPWPYDGEEISEVYAYVNEAPAGSALVIDVNDDGTSILGGTISVSAGATSGSVTGLSVTPAQKSVMTVDIDSVGSTTAGRGLKLLFIFA